MALSIFLGKIVGLYLLISTISILIQQKYYKKVFDELLKHPAFITIYAIIDLIIGLIIIISHNIWISNWPLIITLLGWLIFLKGIFLFLFPQVTYNCIKKSKIKYKIDLLDWIKWICLVFLFVAAYLIYITFIYKG